MSFCRIKPFLLEEECSLIAGEGGAVQLRLHGRACAIHSNTIEDCKYMDGIVARPLVS